MILTSLCQACLVFYTLLWVTQCDIYIKPKNMTKDPRAGDIVPNATWYAFPVERGQYCVSRPSHSKTGQDIPCCEEFTGSSTTGSIVVASNFDMWFSKKPYEPYPLTDSGEWTSLVPIIMWMFIGDRFVQNWQISTSHEVALSMNILMCLKSGTFSTKRAAARDTQSWFHDLSNDDIISMLS